MIPPSLEKLVLSGDASPLTHMHATSGCSIINIPDNCHAIIYNVVLSPFCSMPEDIRVTDAIYSTEQIDRYSTHVFEMSNKNTTRVGFIYRNNGEIMQSPGVEGNHGAYVKNSDPISIDTFLIRTKNIYCMVGRFPGLVRGGDVVLAALSPSTQSPFPNGYGKYASMPTITSFKSANGSGLYMPAGSPDGLVGAGSEPDYVEPFPPYQQDQDFAGICNLGTVGGYTPPKQNWQTPLAIVSYVLINDELLKNFQQ